MLRAPNCDRAPKPRTEMRVSCDGFVRLATVTPGKQRERLVDVHVRLARRQRVGTQTRDGVRQVERRPADVAGDRDDRRQLARQRILRSGHLPRG